MPKYPIHKDFALLGFVPNIKKWMIPIYNILSKWGFNITKAPYTIGVITHQISGFEDTPIDVTVFKPQNILPQAPCLMYCHGGAFFLKATAFHKKMMFEYSEKANCIVVLPHYRVGLHNPFPTGLEDCYAALKWTHDHSEILGIDKDKIAIAGDSAGGNLAACVAQMVLDRQAIHLCFQLLIYPVCDHLLSTASMNDFHDTPLWNSTSSKLMWRIYLNHIDKNQLPNYVSSLQRSDLKGLPPAYVETAEFDCLRDEALLYAKKLKDSNIDVILNQTKGTIHAYDLIFKSAITQENIGIRIQAIMNSFNK